MRDIAYLNERYSVSLPEIRRVNFGYLFLQFSKNVLFVYMFNIQCLIVWIALKLNLVLEKDNLKKERL